MTKAWVIFYKNNAYACVEKIDMIRSESTVTLTSLNENNNKEIPKKLESEIMEYFEKNKKDE